MKEYARMQNSVLIGDFEHMHRLTVNIMPTDVFSNVTLIATVQFN